MEVEYSMKIIGRDMTYSRKRDVRESVNHIALSLLCSAIRFAEALLVK